MKKGGQGGFLNVKDAVKDHPDVNGLPFNSVCANTRGIKVTRFFRDTY